jgi:hypothetical protein
MPAITVLDDALGFVRSHRTMFLQPGVAGRSQCAELLVAQILALGSDSVFVLRTDGWLAVGSTDLDWFVPGSSTAQQFERLIPLPELAVNTNRTEIVLMAFASDIATLSGDSLEVVKGAPPPDELLQRVRARAALRTVVFRFV